MKLRVEHENGKIETIVLPDGALTVRLGPHLNRLIGETGVEVFFTHDGYYDGYGAAATGPAGESSHEH